MAARDMCAEIAALLSPVPDDDDIPHGQLEEEQDEQAEALRAAWDEGGVDPVLSTLARLREERLRLEADMRLLIAYARRFTHPRPYKLVDLASAAGMSISGVRTAYDAEEVDQAAEILGRPPLARHLRGSTRQGREPLMDDSTRRASMRFRAARDTEARTAREAVRGQRPTIGGRPSDHAAKVSGRA